MSYRVAIDIGGTFTDCVVLAQDGSRTVAKALTSTGELEQGVLAALELAAGELGIARAALLEQTDAFVHGTTQATNAMVTRSGARTGLIITKGYEDTLVVGRLSSKIAGLRERDLVHSSQLRKPEPIVPRSLTRGITERLDRDGEVIVALDVEEVRSAIESLLADGVEAIAVSLLWSFLDGRHELAVRELLSELAPQLFVTLSHEIAPVLGEYERTATTAVAAYVGPAVIAYLERLEAALHEEGLRPPLLVMQASGGLTTVADATLRPIVTLDSGPVGGVLGALALSRLYAEPNVVCTDVGGTTFDIGLILNGRLHADSEPVVARYSLRMPKVMIESIGAGGGSIAWLDDGGLLRVGPRSAGSTPGPACYGRGGSEATVTDADVVLGYLDPKAFLGGRMELSVEAARRALETLGKQLGLEPEEVAEGIFRIINAQMADLIQATTVAQGHDPRECVLVAYGGAGPTHAAFYGDDIAVKEILIPPNSTAFSAEGMLTCDITHIQERTLQLRWPVAEQGRQALERSLGQLEGTVLEQFEREGTSPAAVRIERELSIHFGQQVHTLALPLESALVDQATLEELPRRFRALYAATYGEGALLAGSSIEIERHRVSGTQVVEPPPLLVHDDRGEDPSAALRGRRAVYFPQLGFLQSAVYDGDRLASGNLILGPAIIERMGDSVVIPPGREANMDTHRTLHLPMKTGTPAAA